MNLIILTGRAGRDPEVRYFESGTMVANLTLAVKGKRDEDPEWFNLEIWGKQAQVAADYVRKGLQIGVYGRMVTQKWTDRTTGEEKSKPVVTVDRLELMGSKRDNEQQGGAAPASNGQQPAAAPAARPAAQQGWTSSAPAAGGFDDSEVPI